MESLSSHPSAERIEIKNGRVSQIKNVTCVYCGKEMQLGELSAEHVIGRRFVPKGKLDRAWNLIVNACRRCNALKANLEDDISAITMQPDIRGQYVHNDELAAADAGRKAANSFSRRTGKPVQASREDFTINVPMGPGVVLNLNMAVPAQIDDQRANELARLQLMAFFYWLSFNHETKRGGFWQGSCCPINVARRSDWGNCLMRSFSNETLNWQPQLLATEVAGGYFNVAIKRHPETECWSWALEWNKTHRVIGFFGDVRTSFEVTARFPRCVYQQGCSRFEA